MLYYLFDNIFFINGLKNVQGGFEFVRNRLPGSGSGSVIQDYGSADLDPKEIFTDPQH
jgi:hypothetical protein